MKPFDFVLIAILSLLAVVSFLHIRRAGRRQYYHELRQGIRLESFGAIEREADREPR